MAEFSTTQEYDDPVCPCKGGNLFLADMLEEYQNELQISGTVNGKKTPILGTKQPYTLINSAEETINTLSLKVGGEEIELITELEKFGPLLKPDDLRVYSGLYSEPYLSPKAGGDPLKNMQKYRFNSDIETIFVFEVPWAEGLPLGEFNTSDLSEAEEEGLSNTLGKIFGVTFEKTDEFMRSWYFGSVVDAMGKTVKYAKDKSDTLKEIFPKSLHNNPQVLKALRKDFIDMIMSKKVGKTFFQNGIQMLSFRGPHTVGKFISETYFPASKLKMLDVDMRKGAAVKNAAKEVVDGFANSINRFVFVIGAGVTVYQSMRDKPKDWVHLATALGVYVGSYVITNAIVGLLKAGAISLLTSSVVFGFSAGTAAVVVVAGGFLIGVGIGALIYHTGLVDIIADAIRNFMKGSPSATSPVFYTEVAKSSSAHLMGEHRTGPIRAGHETNMLDVIAELNNMNAKMDGKGW